MEGTVNVFDMLHKDNHTILLNADNHTIDNHNSSSSDNHTRDHRYLDHHGEPIRSCFAATALQPACVYAPRGLEKTHYCNNGQQRQQLGKNSLNTS